MTTALSKFNSALRDFIVDLKKFDMVKKDVKKLETYVEITKVNSKILIRGFQTHLLRDRFVKNVIDNDLHFFINYNVDDENDSPENIKDLVKRIQRIIEESNKSGNLKDTDKVFHWLKVLCYYAYLDIGIEPNEKFKQLALS